MNIKVSFTLRFRTFIASHAFLTEIECADVADVRTACSQLLEVPGPELVAALMYFDVISAAGSAPEDYVEKVFVDLCASLKAGHEDFWNEATGSYDPLTNRVTPYNMGPLFPDGTMRIVWREEISVLGFDDTLRILDNALWLLLRLAALPKFQPTEEEEEMHGNWTGPAQDRITNVLFEAGLWPDSSGAFAEESVDVREVFKKHSA
jgi:hypothetical protein